MAARRPSALRTRSEPAARPRPSLYTAQALADFCEVDLKTVHHWADRGKIPHHRTEGRHLRFRRNDVVRFLRAHGYPLPPSLTRARPLVSVTFTTTPEGSPLATDELVKRLGSRFSVRRHPNAPLALAHLLAEEPDVLVLTADDASIAIPHLVAALKADPKTAFIAIACVGGDAELHAAAKAAGAEVTLSGPDAVRLPGELARALSVT